MRFTRSAPLTGGGTINGDLTITGDLTVQGDGAGNYDEIVEGNLVLTSGSKLGVGIGDATPSAPVHVSIAAQDGVSSPLEALRLEVSESFGNVDVGSNQGPAIDFYVPVDSNTSQIGGRIAVGHENGTDTDSAAKLTFTTAPDGASLNASPAITISSTGNVGIGISPLAVFHAKMASNVNFTTTANSSSLRLNAVNDAVDATIQLEINSTDTKFLSPVTIDANATDGTALTIDSEAQDGQGIYMDVSQQTTGYGINIADTGTSRTTGGIIYINSNQNNSGTRNLVDIINNHEGATGATGLKIQQDSSSYAMHISNPTNTTNFGNGLIIATQDENTTSYPLFIKTNSSDADESAGNSRFVVRADGKVGINEINPAAKLQITGGSYNDSLIIKGVSSNSGIQFVDSGGNTDGFAYAENGQIGFLDPGGDWMINAKDDDFIRFAIGANSEKMRIDSSGNVGIGTASPSAKLQIEESTNGADIQFNMRALNDGGTGRTTAIKFDPDARKMHFGEDFTNLILDTSNVRVGIGETPSYKLDVNHGGVSSSDQVIARFMAESSRQLGLVWDDSASTLGLATLTSHNLVFHTGGNSNPRMTIDTSGNVSAGTTATYGNLTVGGTGEIIAGRASSGAGSFSMYEAGTTRFVIESLNGSNGVAFKTPSTARMILDDNSRISLSNNDDGSNNTIFGKNAGDSDGAGDQNVFIGELAGGTGTQTDASDGNTGIGYNSLTALTSGQQNTAIGGNSADAVTTGNHNTAIGYESLSTATVTAGQDEHTAVGYQALKDCSGDRNTAIGTGAMSAVDNSDFCVAVGYNALVTAGSTDDNIDGTTAVGYNALTALTSGTANVALGFETLTLEDAGGGNTAVGYRALKVCNNDTGGNTAVGKDGLVAVTSGNNNTAVGLGAGSNLESGTNNVFIGRNSQANGTGGTNQVVIGGIDTEGNGNNTVTLGNQDATAVYMGEEGGAVVHAAGLKFDDDQTNNIDEANTLDDYEEGYFTGALTCGSGTATVNGSYDQLAYTKIGRMVHVQGALVMSAISSPSGTLAVNLPFTSGTLTEAADFVTGVASYTGVNALKSASLLGVRIGQGSGTASLVEFTTTSEDGSDAANNITASTQIYFGFSYMV